MVMNMMWKLVTGPMGSPFWRPVRCFERIPDTVIPHITGAEYFIDSDPGRVDYQLERRTWSTIQQRRNCCPGVGIMMCSR